MSTGGYRVALTAGNRRGAATYLFTLAFCEVDAAEFEGALEKLGKAAQLFTEVGDTAGQARVAGIAALAECRRGRPDAALMQRFARHRRVLFWEEAIPTQHHLPYLEFHAFEGTTVQAIRPRVPDRWSPEDQEAALARLKESADLTRSVNGMIVNIAVGYGGRREIADAVRSLLQEQAARGTSIEQLAEVLDVEHIAEHLYTKGQPDPDLVIRTSGEQRLGGFLLWQSAHSEFYFCEAFWPDFRRVDFLRALRAYAERERRFGT